MIPSEDQALFPPLVEMEEGIAHTHKIIAGKSMPVISLRTRILQDPAEVTPDHVCECLA